MFTIDKKCTIRCPLISKTFLDFLEALFKRKFSKITWYLQQYILKR